MGEAIDFTVDNDKTRSIRQKAGNGRQRMGATCVRFSFLQKIRISGSTDERHAHELEPHTHPEGVFPGAADIEVSHLEVS